MLRFLTAFTLLLTLSFSTLAQQPVISFSFDDGSTNNFPGYPLAKWNQMLLDALDKHQLKAFLFVTGERLDSEAGKTVLKAWNDAGHGIANHTWTHPFYAAKNYTLGAFTKELLKTDSLVRSYSNFKPFFRFPYLKEGETREKIDGFRAVLVEHNYRIGHVSIDASDWYVSSRLVKALRENKDADLSGFRDFYIQHLFDRAQYYDSLASDLTGRKMSHVMLLHHNPAAALFFDDLVQYFKDKGWRVVNTEEAFADPVYRWKSSTIPAGESIIWAMAKESGKYEGKLRYPAEDGEYEKEKMDKLGL